MCKKLKICCVTGHRKIPPDKIEYITQEISKRILAGIADGYNWFISGFADGTDLIFANIVKDIKREHNEIYLEAALPYSKNTKQIRELLNDCDGVKIVCEKYHQGCFMLRNRYMVDNSDLIIAVYDGRQKGGTFSTLQYARSQGKELQIIEI